MAGRGSRFTTAGYDKPKPLIDVKGKPMIQVVIENLVPKEAHRFIFICQNSHIEQYGLNELLRKLAPNCEIVGIDGITEGAACTVLKAEMLIDNDSPLMIVNSDQYVDTDINDYLQEMEARSLDGLIMTMKADDKKWSFAKIDHDGYVTEVKEKEVISNDATVGIYNFRCGNAFVSYAKEMISNKELQNGEYYVAPVYNKLVMDGLKIGIYDIGSEADGMYGLGTPHDLELFLSLPVSEKVK
jgi:NDP-sugar pyrophosphorylase family protein